MNRFALLAVAIVAVIIGWLVFFAGPTVEPPPPVQTPTVKTDPPPPPTPPVPPPPPTPVADAAPVVDAGPDAAPDAEVQSGPVPVDLGEQEILLAERDGRFLQLHLSVVGADAAAANVIRLKRRTLLRSLYFLVSKRSAEGLASAGGEQRLLDDLLPRFANQVRSVKIDRIDVVRFRIIRKAIVPPDGGL